MELLVRGDANLMASQLQGAGEIEQRHEVAKTGNTAHEHPHTNVSSRMRADPPRSTSSMPISKTWLGEPTRKVAEPLGFGRLSQLAVHCRVELRRSVRGEGWQDVRRLCAAAVPSGWPGRMRSR
jgi:hypothetical protein